MSGRLNSPVQTEVRLCEDVLCSSRLVFVQTDPWGPGRGSVGLTVVPPVDKTWGERETGGWEREDLDVGTGRSQDVPTVRRKGREWSDFTRVVVTEIRKQVLRRTLELTTTLEKTQRRATRRQ